MPLIIQIAKRIAPITIAIFKARLNAACKITIAIPNNPKNATIPPITIRMLPEPAWILLLPDLFQLVKYLHGQEPL
jgi:LytS/YehU family sensor histidine kinase